MLEGLRRQNSKKEVTNVLYIRKNDRKKIIKETKRFIHVHYSRTSVAQTSMARLPRLFRTRS